MEENAEAVRVNTAGHDVIDENNMFNGYVDKREKVLDARDYELRTTTKFTVYSGIWKLERLVSPRASYTQNMETEFFKIPGQIYLIYK